MKFTTILSTLALTAASALVNAAPVARDVWVPKITSPTNGTVWESGETYTVTWDTSDQPHQITNANGFILLRVGDYETPVLLAENFDVRTGSVNVTVPDVITGDDFSIVLFGDSGNWSDQFTINGPISF